MIEIIIVARIPYANIQTEK